VTLATFEDSAVPRINGSGLVEKVRMELDERVVGNSEFGSVVTIETRSGQRLEQLIPLAIGKPERWFPKTRLETKFHDCSARAIGRDHASEIYGLVQGIETAATLRPLIDAVGRAP
jgi:hypothetical protein